MSEQVSDSAARSEGHFRTLVGMNEGLAHAAGAAPLFTSAVSAFLALGPAQP